MINLPKHKIDKAFVPISSFLLLLAAIYIPLKLLKYYDDSFIHDINIYSLIIFSLSICFLILLFYKIQINNKGFFVLTFITFITLAIFSYYFALPEQCHDCKGDIIVGKLSREKGLKEFIKHYNEPALYSIKNDPYRYKRFLKYDYFFRLNYKEEIDKVNDDTPDDDRFSDMAHFRTSKHSPFLFSVIGLWQIFFGENYFSHVILGSLIALLYIYSMFIFLGLFYEKDEFKDKLSIILLLILLPAFLIQATRPKNDLLLGIFVTWTMFLLLRNRKESINIYDIVTGLCLSFAVLSKFTSLTLLFPVILYYIITFKYRALSKLLVFTFGFFIMPFTLYAVFRYDMLLNIISGSIEQTIYNYQNIFIEMLLRRFFLEQYILGIPLTVLSFIYLMKFRRLFFHREILMPFIFICFFFSYFFTLWGSEVARHLTGYLPLAIPMIVIIYKNCSEQRKLILTTAILLLINNYIILVNRYTELNTLLKMRWSFW